MHACLRCPDAPLVSLVSLASPEGIAFFECPACKRQYAYKEGAGLTDRWGSALSVALYPVLFSNYPPAEADRVAQLFLEGHTPEALGHVVREIRDELAQPTQRMTDLVSTRQNETQLRTFFELLANRIEAMIANRHYG